MLMGAQSSAFSRAPTLFKKSSPFCECRSNFPAAESRYRLVAQHAGHLGGPGEPCGRGESAPREKAIATQLRRCLPWKEADTLQYWGRALLAAGESAHAIESSTRRIASPEPWSKFPNICSRVDLLTSSEARFRRCRPWSTVFRRQGEGNGK